MLATLDEHLDAVHRELLHAARHLTGARVLAARLYGVGPITALALTCWLAGAGRFSSARCSPKCCGRGGRMAGPDSNVRHPPERAPLKLAQTTPDPMVLPGGQGTLQAVGPNQAAITDELRSRSLLHRPFSHPQREEQLGVSFPTRRVSAPVHAVRSDSYGPRGS
jgi:hypothetical protein